MTMDEVAITGFSARFPQADDLTEFKDKLYMGADFFSNSDARWPRGYLGLPERFGTIRDLSLFDASFFGVHPRQAHLMDPQMRILLETSYEAIVDAGRDPEALRGRKVGVFIGAGIGDFDEMFGSDHNNIDGFSLLGTAKSMFSNRLSYTFDFRGPSFTVDAACSSTMVAFSQAMNAVRSGECEAALVAASTISLKPAMSLAFMRLGMLSQDGKCKAFDSRCDGFARSETIGAFFLQRVSEAHRVYAKVIHTKASADGYKIQGITYPSGKAQEELLREIYSEAKVDPCEIDFVEAHGTGTRMGDEQELQAITKIFCPSGRQRPLKIGAVKTNVGHNEIASGISSIAKVLLAMETGTIAANLHFEKPNLSIPSLRDGSVEIVSKPMPFNGGRVGVNSFGFGGSSAHAILESNSGPHVNSILRERPGLPRLVLVSGRSSEALKRTLDRIEAEGPYPDSAYALLNRVGQRNVKQFPYRGFAVVPVDGSDKKVIKAVEDTPNKNRPLWFVFSGMGCQWKGMARQMMQIDVFARSVHKSAVLLEQFGVDLINVVISDDSMDKSHASTLSSVTAIQVALVDTLKAIGLQPDGILGHSMGEIACGYADSCFTAEEAVLCAYWRGRCVDIGNVPPGAMAAVGLTCEEVRRRLRDGVVLACHNAEDSVTVSGPVHAVVEMVEELKARGVFARMVDSMNVAFHSKYVHSISSALQMALETVVPEPKRRSERWVSSSVPANCWHEPAAQFCSAEYFVNNLVSPVIFREALEHVPKDAILVEIAPHCLLQPILQRAVGSSATCLGLMKRHTDNLTFFLNTLGKLHTLGVQLDLSPLFPPVTFPVPRGTPSIGHLVSWDHSQKWTVPKWNEFGGTGQLAEDIVTVDLEANEEDAYLAGHYLGGRTLFPAPGYILMAWKFLAKRNGQPFHQLPVIFDDVTFHRATILPKSGPVRFLVNVLRTSGEFEICEAGTVVASGRIRIADEGKKVLDNAPPSLPAGGAENELDADEFYKELRLRGYEYQGNFQAVLKMNFKSCCGTIKWEDNWVTFIDSMVQCTLLPKPRQLFKLPVKIQSCCIDPRLHARVAQACGDSGIPTVYDSCLNTCHAGGIFMLGLKTSIAPRRLAQPTPRLEEYTFVPYIDDERAEQEREASLQEYINACNLVAQRILRACGQNMIDTSELTKDQVNSAESALYRFLKSPAEHYILLRDLTDILRSVQEFDVSIVEAVKSAMARYAKDLGKDLLNTVLLREDCLRHLLDVAVENNTSPKKMRILELVTDENGQLLAPWVLSLLPLSNTLIKTEYTIAHPNLENIASAEYLPKSARTIVWNLGSDSGTDLPEADLIVVDDVPPESSRRVALAKLTSTHCSEGGFVLIHHRTALTPAEVLLSTFGSHLPSPNARKTVESAFKGLGFFVVGMKSNRLSTVILLRKPMLATTRPHKLDVVKVKNSVYDWVDTMKMSILKSENNTSAEKNIWLLADDCCVSGIVGLVNCLRVERGLNHVRCLFDASKKSSICLVDILKESEVFGNILEKDLVMNIYRDGQWGSYRHLTTNIQGALKKTECAVLNISTRGDLSTLHWYESPLFYASPARNTEKLVCSVYYAALNFRDVMLATGKLPAEALPGNIASRDCLLGIEFSGRDPQGRRVMGFVPYEGMAIAVAVDKDFLWEIPETWTLEEASTVPVAYCTAYYALLVRGNMQPGESLLVHSGSGGVGQAAISLALSMGCTVYTTVGSKEKRELLKRRFPQLEDRHIANSRDLSFEEHIRRETKSRGVDLVLNSLSGEKLQASVRCLAKHGRFLEIGKSDLASDSSLGMSVFLGSITFCGILLDSLHEDGPITVRDRRRVKDLVQQGIVSGVVRPLNVIRFTRDQAEEAFRYMASGKHVGKVVLQIRPEESSRQTAEAPPFAVEAVTRTYFYAHKCYVIIGGLGGFALELADWMVGRGCRKLLLSSRSGLRNGYQRMSVGRLVNSGTEVVLSRADASTKQGALQIIEEASAMGPLGGIFNLAMVLRDSLLENQTEEHFEAVCGVKVDATNHLDELSRKFFPELDHFVAFSSFVACDGNVGQTNYGYANSAMERICERRVQDGLPGLAIQWGVIGDVGVLQQAETLGGYAPQRIGSCLRVLDKFLNQGRPVVCSFVKADVSTKPEDTKFRPQDLVETVTHMFGVESSGSLDLSMNLGDLGMDSLIGVEVQQTLERDYDVTLSMTEIRNLTLKRLRQIEEASVDKSPRVCSRTELKKEDNNLRI